MLFTRVSDRTKTDADVRVPQASASARAAVHADIWCPEKLPAERWIALGVFVVSSLYLCLFWDHTNMNGDEGIALQGAQRILQGQMLYRDFFSFYTPGSYYWQALLLKLFGNSILVARAALVFYGGVFSTLTYLTARRICFRWSALFAAYLVALTCLPFYFMANHNWDSTLWAYFTLYCGVRSLESQHWGWPAAAGSFAALTCLFEQSKGGGLVLGLAAGFAAVAMLGPSQDLFTRKKFSALAAGFAWPFVLTFAYFGFGHSLPQMLSDWLWPLQHYSRTNQVNYGYVPASSSALESLHSGSWGSRVLLLLILSPAFLIPTLPIMAVGMLAWWGIRTWRRKNAGPRDCYYILTSAALSGLLLSILITNRGLPHIMFLAPLFYIVLAWILDGSDIRSLLVSTAKPLVVFYLFVAFALFGLVLLTTALGAKHRLETRRGTLKDTYPDTVLSYVQTHLAPGSRVFVYPYQPLYYYLAATFNPTRYDYLQPGLHSPEQFDEVVREMAADRTPVVLLESSFGEAAVTAWPSTPLEILAKKDPVEEYVLSHYHRCGGPLTSENAWFYLYMVRKDLPCPVD
jgi:hypothetical protein